MGSFAWLYRAGIFVDGQQDLGAAVEDTGDRQEELLIRGQRTGWSSSSAALFDGEECEGEWGGHSDGFARAMKGCRTIAAARPFASTKLGSR
jgi:hypothetical protein